MKKKSMKRYWVCQTWEIRTVSKISIAENKNSFKNTYSIKYLYHLGTHGHQTQTLL